MKLEVFSNLEKRYFSNSDFLNANTTLICDCPFAWAFTRFTKSSLFAHSKFLVYLELNYKRYSKPQQKR